MDSYFYRFCALSLFCASSTTLAIASNQTESLDDIIVTATRTDTAQKELASAATVYTREDIDRLQVRSLPELLKGSAGVDIVQQGGYGQPSSVFMRGTNSSHVLVLIDGVKAGSVTAGITAFEFLPIEQIERVEIIRGPQSSLYGSEAIGGVIQIFTRKGKQTDKPSLAMEAGGGSYDTHREAGNVSGRWQNSWYNLGVSNIESNGFKPQVVAPNGLANQGAYNNTAVNARLGHRFENNAELEAFFMRADGLNQFVGYNAQDANHKLFVNQVVGTSLSKDLSENWRSSLNLGQTRDEGSNFLANNQFKSTLNSTRWNVSWLNQIKIASDHKLTLGTDYRVDEVDGSTQYNKTSRYDVGVFGELHSKIFDQHFLNASLRWDQNQAFGDYVTGNLGWRFNWLHGLSAFASFGNAFKAPTFNDLYYPLPKLWGGGNPSLKPEQSTSVETGIAGHHDWGHWELRAYHTNIDNLIAFGTTGMDNINKAQIDGIEAEIGGEFLGWNHKLTGNLLSPRDRINNTRLLRRSDKTLSYDISKRLGAFDLGATVLAQSDRADVIYDQQWNQVPVKVDGFVTLDFRTAYHIDKNWMLSGKLNNVLDKHYQTVSNYNMADRNFFISIHYNH
jgi:vitamin B12 transporter